VQAATTLPVFLVILPAGALADMVDRRRFLLITQAWMVVAASLLGIFTLLGLVTPWLLLLFTFILGLGAVMNDPAWQAITPDIVCRENHAPAVALNSVGFNVARAVGPALGGLLFVAARALPFAVDAASFAVSGILLAAAFAGLARPVAASAGRLRDDIAVGLRYFAKTPIIRVLTAVLAAFALFQALATATLVLYALHRLHVGVAGYGLFVTVTAVGDVGGGLLAARVSARLPTRVLLVSAGVGTGVCYLALGLVPVIGVALPALMFEGIAVTMGVVASMALRQRIIPRDLLGRVGNTVRVVVYGSVPLGALLGGFVASRFGLAAPFVVAGTGQVLVLAVLARPLLRDERRPAMAPGGLAGVGA